MVFFSHFDLDFILCCNFSRKSHYFVFCVEHRKTPASTPTHPVMILGRLFLWALRPHGIGLPISFICSRNHYESCVLSVDSGDHSNPLVHEHQTVCIVFYPAYRKLFVFPHTRTLRAFVGAWRNPTSRIKHCTYILIVMHQRVRNFHCHVVHCH